MQKESQFCVVAELISMTIKGVKHRRRASSQNAAIQFNLDIRIFIARTICVSKCNKKMSFYFRKMRYSL